MGAGFIHLFVFLLFFRAHLLPFFFPFFSALEPVPEVLEGMHRRDLGMVLSLGMQQVGLGSCRAADVEESRTSGEIS